MGAASPFWRWSGPRSRRMNLDSDDLAGFEEILLEQAALRLGFPGSDQHLQEEEKTASRPRISRPAKTYRNICGPTFLKSILAKLLSIPTHTIRIKIRMLCWTKINRFIAF